MEISIQHPLSNRSVSWHIKTQDPFLLIVLTCYARNGLLSNTLGAQRTSDSVRVFECRVAELDLGRDPLARFGGVDLLEHRRR